MAPLHSRGFPPCTSGDFCLATLPTSILQQTMWTCCRILINDIEHISCPMGTWRRHGVEDFFHEHGIEERHDAEFDVLHQPLIPVFFFDLLSVKIIPPPNPSNQNGRESQAVRLQVLSKIEYPGPQGFLHVFADRASLRPLVVILCIMFLTWGENAPWRSSCSYVPPSKSVRFSGPIIRCCSA